ncbi:MATE family efflux transporter [Thalassomonas actiniarum]|uniref:MATE family efflux transporter n=1 Tax=Thalassomonas actiniarum TaxID=485447 RepID=A0AAF0BXG4_9GAMM|nr:MATE family efflux transporter [Thalassomonas actiniarum]WDD97056.1 MATE family efflux transporter [Thalassomonas actiniarum]
MKKLVKLAVPLIISQLVAQLMVLSDVWMMAQISVTTLAAGGLAASVYGFIFILVHSVIGSSANLLAIACGEQGRGGENEREIRKIIKGSLLLSVLVSLALLPLFYNLEVLFVLAGQDGAIITVAMQYLDTLKWAMLPTLLLLVARSFAVAFAAGKSVLWITVISVLLNIVLSYLLAFHFHLGVSGIGAGTAIAAFITAAGYLFWLFTRPAFSRYRPWRLWSEYRLATTLPLIKIGSAVALATLTEYSLISGAALMAGTLGAVSLAIHQIALQILSFSWNIAFGIAQATSMEVGQQFGAGQGKAEIKKTSVNGLVLATVISAVIGIAFILYPNGLTALFASEQDVLFEELVLILPTVILVTACCLVVDAWQLMALNILRGLKIVTVPALLTAVGYCLAGLPAAWLLMANFQLAGIWAGIGLGLALTGILLLFQLQVSMKKLAG